MELMFLRLLDELERKEVQSLTWGYADGSFSRDNVLKLASRVLKEASDDSLAEDLVEDLIEKKLIFEFGGRIFVLIYVADGIHAAFVHRRKSSKITHQFFRRTHYVAVFGLH